MHDRQVEQTSTQARIPYVSDVLHGVALTVVVFLRSSFGYLYLRPKAVFLSFAWAALLFAIYAWHEPRVWAAYWPVCLYSLSAAGLYAVHLAFAALRQPSGQAEHDLFSGTSHAVRFRRWRGKVPGDDFAMHVHLWGEPIAVLLAALLLRHVFAEQRVSAWLFLAAPCLCAKEVMNYWYRLRQRKRQKDILDDAQSGIEAQSSSPPPEPPKPTRQPKQTRQRVRSPEPDARERRSAEILRLLPPYSLAQAEANFTALIKEHHPDHAGATAESHTRSVELNEAIEYFRERLGE
jgi:hypothetical protein